MSESLIKQLENILQEKITDFPVYSGKLTTESGKTYFLKTGVKSGTYSCEAHGLEELGKASAIRVASPITYGDTYILTELVEQGRASIVFFETFGRQFAQLHKCKGDTFGFYENNFIGANEQINIATGDEGKNWVAFYYNKRLLYQYKLAEKNGFVSEGFKKDFARLENKIEGVLAGSQEVPALLHGDLWSGNFLCNERGEAVLIDPAVYYGHREADLAMTKLFGGFSASFYSAYQQEYPLPEGWEYREDMYKLYHLMNHLNIFGKGYLAETEWIVRKYVK